LFGVIAIVVGVVYVAIGCVVGDTGMRIVVTIVSAAIGMLGVCVNYIVIFVDIVAGIVCDCCVICAVGVRITVVGAHGVGVGGVAVASGACSIVVVVADIVVICCVVVGVGIVVGNADADVPFFCYCRCCFC